MSVFSKLDPNIITFHILPHLDGKTLIILSSVSSQFHNLIWKNITNNSDLWRNICTSTWPSLLTTFPRPDFLSIISMFPGGYRSFFLDAFPSIHPPLNNPPPPPPLPPQVLFFYAVDIFLHGEGEQQPLYSLQSAQLIETIRSYCVHPMLNPRIFGTPLDHTKAELNFIKVEKEGCAEYLKQKLRFSLLAIDRIGLKRGVSLFNSGSKAVSAELVNVGRFVVNLGVMVVFESVLPVPAGLSNFYTETMKCRTEVTCSWEGDGEDKFRVRSVYFTMKDMNGISLLEAHGAAVILNAIQNGVRRGRTTSTQLV